SMHLPQPFERSGSARLDGAAADPERSRGFLLGQREQVAALEDEPLPVRKLLDRVEEAPALGGCDGQLLGRGGRLTRGARGRAKREPLAPTGTAAAVTGLVRGDR